MKKRGTFASVLYFADECRGKILLSVLFAVIGVAGGLVPYLGVYQIILLFFSGRPTTGQLVFWTAVSAGGYGIKILFHGISTTFSHISAYRILESIRLSLSHKLMRLPLGDVLSQTAGSLKTTIVDKVETMELSLAHMIPEGISNLLIPICVFAYLLFTDWRIALSAIACVPIGAVIYGVMMRSYGEKYAKYMEASSHVNSVIIEYTEGIQVIKAFNQSTGSYRKYSDSVMDFRNFTLDWFRSTWGLMNLGNAILPTTLLGVLPAGVLLYLSGALTPAQVTLAIILSMSIMGPASWFSLAVNDYKSIQFSIKEVNAILSMPNLPEAKTKVTLKNYDVTLSNVSFSYDEKAGNVLHQISLKLPQGSFTALVGPSGGGKSTVARLIARFWEVSEGSISIGETDIRNIPFSQLVEGVSFVSQDNFLFNCSLLENIRLGNLKATDEEVYQAAKAACCDEFITRFPKGLNTPAGEAGGRLSGGERQRIAIARAILKDAPIVILDEATSFTDPESEAQLQSSIAALSKGKTLLVIAHRLSTIKTADNIVILQNGKINAQGSHERLLEESPLYKEMWKAHVGAKKWSATTGGKSYV